MKDHGIMDICMAKDYSSGKTHQNMMDNLLMGKSKDLEFSYSPMETITKGTGLEESKRELELYIIKTNKR